MVLLAHMVRKSRPRTWIRIGRIPRSPAKFKFGTSLIGIRNGQEQGMWLPDLLSGLEASVEVDRIKTNETEMWRKGKRAERRQSWG